MDHWQDDQFERRRRHSVMLDASVTASDGTTRSATIVNVSLDGCCIAGDFPIAERVKLAAEPIGTIEGQIRWAFNGHAGVRFLAEGRATTPR